MGVRCVASQLKGHAHAAWLFAIALKVRIPAFIPNRSFIPSSPPCWQYAKKRIRRLTGLFANRLWGGTWRRLTFVPATHPIPGLQAVFVNRFTNIFHEELEDQVKNSKLDRKSIPNTHGSAPFVVKVQLNSLAAGGHAWPALQDTGRTVDPPTNGKSMYIYDRERTFRVTAFTGIGDAGTFDDVANVVNEKGYQGLKMFCWAIRSGESTVDVYIDHLPEWQKW